MTYFGKGIKAQKIISYAATFGRSISTNESIPHEVISQLHSLDSISVRDDNSLKIIQHLSLKAEKVLDPTFLYNVKLPNFGKNISDYILLYILDIAPGDIFRIQEYARLNNKKLIAVGYSKDWCDKSFVDVDVFEWLNFFTNASFVITNTFHGTIYSILFRKRFCVLEPEKSVKITSLLNDLSLYDHYIKDTSTLSDCLSKNIDYDAVFQRIELFKKKSMNYLREKLCLD